MSDPAAKAPERERPYELAALGVLLLAVCVLRSFGRTWWCKCGESTPWSFQVQSMHNSQHLLDPYTFTHVLHGLAYCAVLSLCLGALTTPRFRLALAITVEALWEVLENTSWIIERYRAETLSYDYYGDSILNSISDVIACTLGYLIARRLPVWASVVLFVAIEAALLSTIRDSLGLNVLQLLAPIDAIRDWQGGG